MCEAPLYHTAEPITVPVDLNQPARPAEVVNIYKCEDCPFIGFEYYNRYDTAQLAEHLER